VSDAGSVKVSSEETGQVGSAEDLAKQLQKQCAIVSAVPSGTSQVMPGVTAGQLCAPPAALPPNIGVSTSEQLRQLLTMVQKKNDSWSSPQSDRQLVVADEIQNSISKVCSAVSAMLLSFMYVLLTISLFCVLISWPAASYLSA